jgi:hypothetical protein
VDSKHLGARAAKAHHLSASDRKDAAPGNGKV